MIGGFGNDFIVTDEDDGEMIAGAGNDFILGDRADEEGVRQRGRRLDRRRHRRRLCRPRTSTPRGLDQIVGNDVYIGDSISDRMDGEGGDDILVGNHGAARWTAISASPGSTGRASRTIRSA